MKGVFITEINIHKVRHLSGIKIPLSKNVQKNLIITGKNGSGKTSVLKAIARHLEYIVSKNFYTKAEIQKNLSNVENALSRISDSEEFIGKKENYSKNIQTWCTYLEYWENGCTAEYTSIDMMREKYAAGQFILAYYSDNRKVEISEYKNIEKITLKPVYDINDAPSKDLGKYLVNLKSTQAFAREKGNMERAKQIADWFTRFENILRRIYQEDSLVLDFDIETYQFTINITDREPFSFNTMSMGYSAVFEIIGDLMMRMESQHRYDLEGIVLIDEIETHLHVELQREIVPILTELFPNIQFILTTHSPFILNSAKNAVVYDLEKKLLVEEGLTDLPYSLH